MKSKSTSQVSYDQIVKALTRYGKIDSLLLITFLLCGSAFIIFHSVAAAQSSKPDVSLQLSKEEKAQVDNLYKEFDDQSKAWSDTLGSIANLKDSSAACLGGQRLQSIMLWGQQLKTTEALLMGKINYDHKCDKCTVSPDHTTLVRPAAPAESPKAQ